MIFIASDHAGFELKNQLIDYLKSKGLEVEDCGATVFNQDDDYPDFIYPCAQKVAAGSSNRGIVIGYSGQGEALVANKVKGIRAAVYYGGNLEIVKLSRQHNDSNVLSLGARFLSEDEAKQAVDLWLETKFEGDRHKRRIEKITKIEVGKNSSTM
ncbi:MAG: RpiB/LacA/LacB family sugar-phosphate isomerase [Patescibacteria group bacterium]